MCKRKSCLFQSVLSGLALSLMIFFSLPCTLPAEEKAGGIDDISLGEILNLDPTMVTATKRKISVRKAPAIATVITADEIRNMGARDLTDVLKMVPGFGGARTPDGRHMFEVRGIRTLASEKILVMMDGHRLNESYLGSGLAFTFEDLSVEKIRQIEIIRGPGSALYGTSAFVAAINIITKDGNDIDGIEATAAGGTFSTKKVSILGGKSFEDKHLNLFGSIDYVKTDGGDITIEADSLSGTPFSKAPGKADLGLEKTDAFLKVSYGDLTFKGHFMQKDKGCYIGWADALTDYNIFKHKDIWSELSYAKAFTERFSASLRAYFDYFEQESDLELLPKGFPGFPGGAIGRPDMKGNTFGTELQFDLDMFEDNHLIAGFNFDNIRQYDVRYGANYNPFTMEPLGSLQEVSSWANYNRNVTRKVWAVYLQDEWRIMENLNLTAGVRHDNYDDFGSTTNPRAGIVWNFMKDADLKLLYGQAFRAPSFWELYNDANPDVRGNPDLKPEKIKTYEAGLGYRFKNSYEINANYFYNEIDDMIVWDYSTSPGHSVNQGGAIIDGVEIVLRGKYSPADYWQLTYTWQNPEDADTGEELPNVPSHRASFSINWELCKYLNAHTDVLWTGKRPRVSGDDRGDMPSYTTVDLTLIAKNFWKNLEVRGMIHNLFDEEYEDPDMSGQLQQIPYDYPREGISALIEFSYKF
jgi:outer membrane cobalamin receptor